MKLNPVVTLIIVTALIAASGAFWFFFIRNKTESTLTTSTVPSAETAQFQALAAQLKSVDLKTDIFNDARFNYLMDSSVGVIEEAHGRTDPFAPVVGITQQ